MCPISVREADIGFGMSTIEGTTEVDPERWFFRVLPDVEVHNLDDTAINSVCGCCVGWFYTFGENLENCRNTLQSTLPAMSSISLNH